MQKIVNIVTIHMKLKIVNGLVLKRQRTLMIDYDELMNCVMNILVFDGEIKFFLQMMQLNLIICIIVILCILQITVFDVYD